MQVLSVETRKDILVKAGEGEYTLRFSVSNVAELEAKLGRPMKQLRDWLAIESKELPIVLACGFEPVHKEGAEGIAEMLYEALDPEAIMTVIDGLAEANFPRGMKEFREVVKRVAEGVRPKA